MNYNLEERTAVFGENIIKFIKTIQLDEFTKPLIRQIIKSSTSIGANYMEANQASSKKILKIKLEFLRKRQTKLSIG